MDFENRIKAQIDDKALDKFDFTLQNNGDIKFYVLTKNKDNGKITQIFEPDNIDMKIRAKTDEKGYVSFEPFITKATFSNDTNLNLANSNSDRLSITYEVALLAQKTEPSDKTELKSKNISLVRVDNKNILRSSFSNSPFFLNENGDIQNKSDNSTLEVIDAFKTIYNMTDDKSPFFRSMLDSDKILNKDFVKELEEFYKYSIKGKSVSEVINAGEELQLLREFNKDVMEHAIYESRNGNINVEEFKIIDIDTTNQNSNTPYGSYSFEANIKMNVNGVEIDDKVKFETNEESFMQSFTQMLQRNDVVVINNNNVSKIDSGNLMGDKTSEYEVLVGKDGYISGNIESDKIGREEIELISDDLEEKISDEFPQVSYGEVSDLVCDKADFAKNIAIESIQKGFKELGLDNEVAILFNQDGYKLNFYVMPILPKENEFFAFPFTKSGVFFPVADTQIAIKTLLKEDDYNQICRVIADTQLDCLFAIENEVKKELEARYSKYESNQSCDSFLQENDFFVSNENKVILDNLYKNANLELKVIHTSNNELYDDNSVIRVSVNGNTADIELVNDNLDNLIDDLRKNIRDFYNENADLTFFGGDEMLSTLLKEKNIDELKDIVGQTQDETNQNKPGIRKR